MDNGEVIRTNVKLKKCRFCRQPIMLGQNQFGRWLPVSEVSHGQYKIHSKICNQVGKEIKPYYAS